MNRMMIWAPSKLAKRSR